VKAAAAFHSDIRIANLTTGSRSVPAKSIIGVLSLGVQCGHRVRLQVDGTDERTAAATLRTLIEAGLEESLEGPPAHEAASRATGG
jgi:phosphocarrier protein FPr